MTIGTSNMLQRISLTGLILLSGVLTIPKEASAVPAFARQTSMPCTACHFQHFPALNTFGRAFRAGGYTMTGGQGLIEGDDLSMPATLNASVIAKLRYVKTNGNSDQGTDRGEIQWPDEAALLIGGRLAEKAGFLMELGLVSGVEDDTANAFLSTKVHFNVAQVGNTQLSAIPFSTDGLGSGYGFELLNTGAQRSQRPIEDRKGFSAAQALGLASGAATGLALVASSNNYFLNYSPWVPGWGGTDMEVAPSGLAHYFRAAYTPFIGSWDTGFGVQYWTGDAEVADGPVDKIIATNGWVIDGQAQGNVGGMPLGIYASYGECSHDADHFVGNCSNANDADSFAILGQLGVIPNKVDIYAAYRMLDDGKATDSEFNSVTLGANYMFAQNVRLEFYYVTEDGSGVDARADGHDNKFTLQLFAGF